MAARAGAVPLFTQPSEWACQKFAFFEHINCPAAVRSNLPVKRAAAPDGRNARSTGRPRVINLPRGLFVFRCRAAFMSIGRIDSDATQEAGWLLPQPSLAPRNAGPFVFAAVG
jgi:hypothetical protein